LARGRRAAEDRACTKRKVLGIFRQTAEGGRILPIEKGSDREWMVPARETGDARDGELVEAEQIGPRSRMGLPVARVVERLGDPTAPKAISAPGCAACWRFPARGPSW